MSNAVEIVGHSDTGLVRSQNEDYIGNIPEIGVAVLADGMGGYRGGEIASAIAVNTIMEQLNKTVPNLAADQIDSKTGYYLQSVAARESIVLANEAIYKAAQEQPQYQGMGTTVVVAIINGNRMTISHVGDSRLYRIRNNTLEQVTVDHTLMQELVDRGFYTKEEARESLNKNLVTRALGIELSVAVDIKEEMVVPGDLYMLCSDGLHDMVDDEKIASIIQAHQKDLANTASELIKAANEHGGKDNISVLLIKIHSTGKQGGWLKRLLGIFSK